MAERARHSEVLLAARGAFHELGFEGTSTREIAGRLGILGGSLYYYIDSKEALLFEILTAVQLPGRAAVARALADADTPATERLDALLREHVRATLADPVGIELTFSELGALSPEHRAEVLNGLRDYRRGVEALIAAGMEDGSVRPGLPPKIAALAVLGALNWVHRWYRRDGRLGRAALTEQLSGLLLDGLVSPGAPEGEPPPVTPAPDGPPVPPRRRELLDAAAELFAERGYDATTTTDIAERLGLQKASLYHYVRGKRELLHALVREAQEPSLAMLAAIRASDAEPLAKLRAVVERHALFLIRNRTRTVLYLDERRNLSAERRAEVLAGEREYASGVVELIREGRRAGAVRETVDAAIAGQTLLGAVNWLHRWYRPGGGPDERLAAQLADVLLRGLAARPRVS
jgi:TetR/AcrR family transcriptional regulator, cholesterol catabolism regulator